MDAAAREPRRRLPIIVGVWALGYVARETPGGPDSPKALLILMPLTGWAWTSSAGRPVMFLGLFELPALLAANDETKALLGNVHRTPAWITAAVIAGHVAAAIKHWLLDKDDVLASMLGRSR